MRQKMKRRTFNIITILSLLLGMATVGLWILSYWGAIGWNWPYHIHHRQTIRSVRGVVYYAKEDAGFSALIDGPSKGVVMLESGSGNAFRTDRFSDNYQFVGFEFAWSGKYELVIGMPFWFLTIVLAFTSRYAWRKTGRQNPVRGFPVETGKITT
jgi:hypothetical protein